jgi:hypothetical protein
MQDIMAKLEGDKVHVHIVRFEVEIERNSWILTCRSVVIPTRKQDSIRLERSRLSVIQWETLLTRE